MARAGLGAALLMVVLMASTSGCMGLIAARESVEALREPAYEDLNNEKITVIHAFENIDEDLFTDKVREFDEISRLDPQTTTLLLEIKTRIKASAVDIT